MSHPNTAGCPVPEFPCYGHRFGVLPAPASPTAVNASQLYTAALARSSLAAVEAKVAAGQKAPHKPLSGVSTPSPSVHAALAGVLFNPKPSTVAPKRGCCDVSYRLQILR